MCAEFLQNTECATNALKSTATQRCLNETIAELLKSFSASQIQDRLTNPAVYCRWERTRSSAVAMIADRTAYDVRYTGKLSNRFSHTSLRTRLVRTNRARSALTGRVYERTLQTQSTQAWPLSVSDRPNFSSSRSQWITERNTTSSRLIVCLSQKTHVRVFFDSFVLSRFLACLLWTHRSNF